MKTLRVRQLDVSLTDFVGAGALLLIAAAGYLLLVHRPLQDSRRLKQTRATHGRIVVDLSAARNDAERIRTELDATSRQLASIGGGLPDADRIDRYLGRIAAIATVNGVSIDTLAPLPSQVREDYRETYVHLVCRGPFTGLHRMLRQIERELDYADVTHFSISTGEAQSASCLMDWSLRVYSTLAPGTAKAVARAP
jgi:Tfp pilus assembly protein PilO